MSLDIRRDIPQYDKFIVWSEAFDKVWQDSLLYQLNKFLPVHFVNLLKSYKTNRIFRMNHESEYSELRDIWGGETSRSVLNPILFFH